MSKQSTKGRVSRASLGVFAAALLLAAGGAWADTPGLPIQATEVATKWDALYNFLVVLSIFFFVLVIGAMLFFVWKYRAKPGVKTKYIADHHLLEGVWTFIPFVLLMVIFVWGYAVYDKMISAPSDAMEVRVIGKQWLWQFQYEDGRSTINEVFVPVNRPVKFVMTSTDVIHSFFVPNFRVKQDVVPGMYSSVWFEATVPGQHQVFCTEYCGAAHSQMLAKLVALEPQQWEEWKRGKKLLASDFPKAGETAAISTDRTASSAAAASTASPEAGRLQLTLAEQGKAHFQSKGCVACHSVDGAAKGAMGPSLRGVFGSEVALLNGSKVVADDNYIRESIENPMAKVKKGFNPVMPTFKGQLAETEMNALITYIKSLK
jgi:cytochrome c oxidase subunit 2